MKTTITCKLDQKLCLSYLSEYYVFLLLCRIRKTGIQKDESATTSNGTVDNQGETSEEEWTLYGLSKVDVLSIGLPMVVGIPGKKDMS